MSLSTADALLPFGLPTTDSLEPSIDPFWKPVDFVESLAELFGKIEKSSEVDKSLVYLEQYCLLCSLGDPKLLWRCLQSARQHAVDVHSKVVLSAWLRYDRREDELVGTSALDCIGRVLECPKAALTQGYLPSSVFDHCQCSRASNESSDVGISPDKEFSGSNEDNDVCFFIGDEEVYCSRKMRGDDLVELLNQHVQQWSPADCWMHLYERWSSVDDIGSLAVIHQMLINDPGKSVLWFRQSLLLLRLNCQKAAMRSLRLARNYSNTKHERLVYEGWILYDSGLRDEALSKAEEYMSIQRSLEAIFLKAYASADANLEPEASAYVVQHLGEALRCPSDGLRKGQALNNLGSIYVDCGKLDLAADYYVSALKIKHTRAHQGLAQVYHLKNDKKAAYDEMTKLIDNAQNKASAYEKRSEYCDHDMANSDLSMASQLDPLRTYPYRYRAAVLMDDQRENEAVEELTKTMAFKPDLQMLNLRAAFHESMGDLHSALRDCQAALCLDQNLKDPLDLYSRTKTQVVDLHA